MNKEDLAKQLYAQYKLSIEAQYTTMPEWEELSEQERKAWVAVADYVTKEIVP